MISSLQSVSTSVHDVGGEIVIIQLQFTPTPDFATIYEHSV